MEGIDPPNKFFKLYTPNLNNSSKGNDFRAPILRDTPQN